MNWKNWKIKVLWLSTYNSLNSQSKLKDQVIQNEIKRYDILNAEFNKEKVYWKTKDEMYLNQAITIGKLQDNVKSMEEMNRLLAERNRTQSNTIHEIHNERYNLLEAVEQLQTKLQRKDQPRTHGRFASKVKPNENL